MILLLLKIRWSRRTNTVDYVIASHGDRIARACNKTYENLFKFIIRQNVVNSYNHFAKQWQDILRKRWLCEKGAVWCGAHLLHQWNNSNVMRMKITIMNRSCGWPFLRSLGILQFNLRHFYNNRETFGKMKIRLYECVHKNYFIWCSSRKKERKRAVETPCSGQAIALAELNSANAFWAVEPLLNCSCKEKNKNKNSVSAGENLIRLLMKK